MTCTDCKDDKDYSTGLKVLCGACDRPIQFDGFDEVFCTTGIAETASQMIKRGYV